MLRKSLALLVFTWTAFAQEGVYKNDFEMADLGKLPKEFMVIDGAFSIVQENNNKFLELPGAPLDSYALLFGPTDKENRIASARVYGTSKGRRFPTFAIGLGGVGGYKLQVSPGKKELELFKADEVKTSVPFDWKSGKWLHLSIAVKKVKDTQWTVEGRAWSDGEKEPETPTLKWFEIEQPPSGRAYIGGSPYSTTPIRFDDLYSAPTR